MRRGAEGAQGHWAGLVTLLLLLLTLCSWAEGDAGPQNAAAPVHPHPELGDAPVSPQAEAKDSASLHEAGGKREEAVGLEEARSMERDTGGVGVEDAAVMGEEAQGAREAEPVPSIQIHDERKNADAAPDSGEGDPAHISAGLPPPPPSVAGDNHTPHDAEFVIEEDDVANHGLVEYSAPEEQALDHLINMASRGLQTLASSAVLGFHRARMVVTRAADRVRSKPLAETINKWLGVNDTARKESMNAAHKAILSVHQTTAVVLAQAPDYFERSRQVLDQVAQRSVERALEVAVFSAQVAEVVGAASLQVARETKRRAEIAIASPEGQAALAWIKASAAHVRLVGQEALKVTANRILWVMADQSKWLPPPASINFKSGLLLVYRDTNNIHAHVPIFTKAHQFLGTFADEAADGDDAAGMHDDDDAADIDGEERTEGAGGARSGGGGGSRGKGTGKRRDFGAGELEPPCVRACVRACVHE